MASLTLKIENTVKWEWRGVFWIYWLFLVIILLYSIGLFVITLFTAFYMY